MTFEKCLKHNTPVLMEGALGERLKREFGLKIDGIAAMSPLVYSEKGRSALKSLWLEYAKTAEKYNLPFLATTPTRRANKERVADAGYDSSIIKANMDFLKEIRNECSTQMFIGGLMGCKGDAYTGEGALSADEAYTFHSWQAQLFAKENADFLYAGIMPCAEEALGMAKAMSDTKIPYIISFTIEKNGRLIDGTTINDAIELVDRNTENKPLFYMTNCVHPSIVLEALSKDFNSTKTVRTRFKGIQANTSPLSYAELDGAEDLKSSDPESLAEGIKQLKDKHGFTLFGGCCGTDNRHMMEIAKRISQ